MTAAVMRKDLRIVHTVSNILEILPRATVMFILENKDSVDRVC